MVDCKVCQHPLAFSIMTKVFAGEMTYLAAAKELDLPVPTVWHCFAEHWQVEATDNGTVLKPVEQLETVEDFTNYLKILLKRFITRINSAMQLSVSAYNESAVTKLSAEFRALMRDILEFEGKLKTAPLVQLNILQAQMTKLTAFLFSELCETDRAKLLKAIPELIQNESVGAIAESPPSS